MKSLLLLSCIIGWSSFLWGQHSPIRPQKYWVPEKQLEALLASIDDSEKREVLRHLFSVTDSRMIAPILEARDRILESNIPSAQALVLMHSASAKDTYNQELAAKVSWQIADLTQVLPVIINAGFEYWPIVEHGEESISLRAGCRLVALPVCQTLNIKSSEPPENLSHDGLKRWLLDLVKSSQQVHDWNPTEIDGLVNLSKSLESASSSKQPLVDQHLATPNELPAQRQPTDANDWRLWGVILIVIILGTLLFFRRSPS